VRLDFYVTVKVKVSNNLALLNCHLVINILYKTYLVSRVIEPQSCDIRLQSQWWQR